MYIIMSVKSLLLNVLVTSHNGGPHVRHIVINMIEFFLTLPLVANWLRKNSINSSDQEIVFYTSSSSSVPRIAFLKVGMYSVLNRVRQIKKYFFYFLKLFRCVNIKNNFKKINKYYFNIFSNKNTLKNNYYHTLKYLKIKFQHQLNTGSVNSAIMPRARYSSPSFFY
jgi:hypothetical protein